MVDKIKVIITDIFKTYQGAREYITYTEGLTGSLIARPELFGHFYRLSKLLHAW